MTDYIIPIGAVSAVFAAIFGLYRWVNARLETMITQQLCKSRRETTKAEIDGMHVCLEGQIKSLNEKMDFVAQSLNEGVADLKKLVRETNGRSGR